MDGARLCERACVTAMAQRAHHGVHTPLQQQKQPSPQRMNYAEDRLDRRARHVDSSSKDGLWADYQKGLELQQHELLARTLRDVGWCRHAVFHAGMAWKYSWNQVGDYAQMLEFAGFPELGVLALLHYRSGRQVFVEEQQGVTPSDNDNSKDPSWLRQNPPPKGDCGCGYPDCGRRLFFLLESELRPVFEALQQYDEQCQHRMADMPSSYAILASLAKPKPLCIPPDVPALLQFWKTDESDEIVSLEPVLQLLLVKLTYVTIPALAAEAVVHLKFENPRALANDYKSHWAYYVMLRAIVLGDRIKPERRQLLADSFHVPVWDLLWHKDRRLVDRPIDDDSYRTFATRRIQWSEVLSRDSHGGILPTVQWSLPSAQQHRPLFVVGDSHVLSIAWTTVFLPDGEPRLVVPLVVTGLKAWHTRQETYFFAHSLLHSYIGRLPANTGTILLSAGEIDCREGIGGPLLEGYKLDYQSHVHRTVQEYVRAVSALAEQYSLQILVMPVAPHAHRSDRNGKSAGRKFRRRIMQAWNEELRMALPLGNVFLLDYEERVRHEESTSPVGYVLNPVYNLDGTHTNSAILPLLEAAIEQSGCTAYLL